MKKVINRNSLIYHIASEYGNLSEYSHNDICSFRQCFIAGLCCIFTIICTASLILSVLLGFLPWVIFISINGYIELQGLEQLSILLWILITVLLILFGILSAIRKTYCKVKEKVTVNSLFESWKEKLCYKVDYKDF